MVRLCQGVGKAPNESGQRIKGMDILFVIDYEKIPCDQHKDITYTFVVCTVRPQKEDPNRTRITIGVNDICYTGDVGTPTASLELFKLIVNIIISRQGAQYDTFDIKKFYLGTPLNWPEYIKVHLYNIPQEFIYEYDLEKHTRDGRVYLEIRKGV